MVPQQILVDAQFGPVPPQLHEPPTQLSPGSQLLSHTPQCRLLVLVSTHWLSQQVRPPQSPLS